MRMVLEHLCGGLMRGGANHGEGAELVAVVGNTAATHPLGLAERPAHLGERRLVLLNPRLPGGHALLLFGLTVGLRQRIPRRKFCAVLAADENGQIGIAHLSSLLLISPCGPAVR